jgi:hypothetical protein
VEKKMMAALAAKSPTEKAGLYALRQTPQILYKQVVPNYDPS